MKIVVCIPIHRSVQTGFFKSYAAMLAHSLRARSDLQIALLTEEQGSLEMKRNRLAVRARASGADYLLWLDDDHVFPPTSLIRLISHDLPVVGCNLVNKADIPQPTAFKAQDQRLFTTEPLAAEGKVEEVRVMGLGLCLMKLEVFDALDRWAQGKGAQRAWPLFASRTNVQGEVETGEDVYFFDLLRAAGVPIRVDHGLSWEVGHIAQTVKTHAQAAAALPSP